MELSDLTIIVPTKYEAHNIGRFLQSVPRNVNIIVVDSSTDGITSTLHGVQMTGAS